MEDVKNPRQKAVDPNCGESAPPGLDAQQHADAQRAAHHADFLRNGIFSAFMSSAVGCEDTIDRGAFKIYLERLIVDAGNPQDPIERMLLEQLALAHFRIGKLHVAAGEAEGIVATKILNSVAVRLLGEFRRTALALRAYKGRIPEGRGKDAPKIYKMAQ